MAASNQEKIEPMKIVRGIDISKWQGLINWEYIRPEFEFIIVRACRINGGAAVLDDYCLQNIHEAIDRGYKVGVYIYIEKFGWEGIYRAADRLEYIYNNYGSDAFKMGIWLDPEYEALNNVDSNIRVFSRKVETALGFFQEFADEIISPLVRVGLYYNYDFYHHVYEKKICLPQHYHWRVGFAKTRRAGDLYQNTSSERLYVKECPDTTRVDVDEIIMTIPMYNKFKYGKAGGAVKHGAEQ